MSKPLPRASSVCRAEKLDQSRIVDRVVLDADERQRCRVEEMRGLGAHLTPIEAPFDPEPGAYAHQHAHGPHRHGA